MDGLKLIAARIKTRLHICTWSRQPETDVNTRTEQPHPSDKKVEKGGRHLTYHTVGCFGSRAVEAAAEEGPALLRQAEAEAPPRTR